MADEIIKMKKSQSFIEIEDEWTFRSCDVQVRRIKNWWWEEFDNYSKNKSKASKEAQYSKEISDMLEERKRLKLWAKQNPVKWEEYKQKAETECRNTLRMFSDLSKQSQETMIFSKARILIKKSHRFF